MFKMKININIKANYTYVEINKQFILIIFQNYAKNKHLSSKNIYIIFITDFIISIIINKLHNLYFKYTITNKLFHINFQ